MTAVRVGFVYANPRATYIAEVAQGIGPDTALLGMNHFAELGVEAGVHEPLLTRPGSPVRLPRRVAWNLRELTLPLEVGRYDVVYAALGPLAGLAARARRRPRLLLLNMSLCNRLARASGGLRRLYVAGLRDADVVCFAAAQRERLIEQTGAAPERVHLVELGIDAEFLRASSPPPPDGHVLAVGRDLGRDYLTLARAVRDLDARVVVVASKRNVAGLTLPPNVDLRLDVDPLELRDLYEGARVVAVPSRHEGVPVGADCSGQTVLLESWAMERPVVASDRSTLAGYATDGANALIVPPGDAGALHEALDRVLSDALLARRLGEAGRRDVEDRFTTRLLARRLVELARRVHESH